MTAAAYRQTFERTDACLRPVVLGFGNVLLRDDGIGVRVVERVGAALGAEAAEFIDAGTLSFTLLPHIEAHDALLVIDAADLERSAGSIELFEGSDMDEFLAHPRRRSVHEVGLMDLLDMARLRDCLPPRRALLCIQPSCIEWGETLSAAVAQALPAAADRAAALIDRWRRA